MTVLLRVFEYSQFFFNSNLELLFDTYNSLYLEKPANVFEQYQNTMCELYIKNYNPKKECLAQGIVLAYSLNETDLKV